MSSHLIYFLDTNICIYFLNGTFEAIGNHFKKLSPKDIRIPAIVKAELLFGLEKSKRKNEIKEKYEQFLNAFEIIPFDDAASYHYAKIRFELERKGIIIGGNDLLIASTVLSRQGILITHNTKEFKRVPQLVMEDWTV
jgi:tRNA(fMet)-specific endonuclease VapC